MTAKRNLELIPPHFRLTPCPNSRRAAARFVFRLVSLSFRPTGVVCHVDRLDRSRHHRHHRAVCAYNRLVALSQRVGQIPNLVETVKGYASHERGTLDDVIKARNSAMSAQGPAQVSAAENQLSGALGRLIALSEAYPDLKANANFQQLASELSDLENKIAASRRFFNNAVQEYNTGIQQLPAALFAGMFGFTRKEFFDLGASRTEVEAVPTVKF
jgi:LemA protein